jgi:hypothetical protein
MPEVNISGPGGFAFHSAVQIGVATSDADGKWIIRTVRENADDLRLGHYASQPDTSRYSIGVIGPDRQTKLLRDITVEEHAVPKSIEMSCRSARRPRSRAEWLIPKGNLWLA